MFNISYTDEKGIPQTKQITVEQQGIGRYFNVAPDTVEVFAKDKEGFFTITSNSVLEIKDDGQGWFSIDKKEFKPQGVETKSEKFTVTFDKNTKLQERNGKISIIEEGKVIKELPVIQRGTLPSVNIITSTSIILSANEGAKDSISVKSNVALEVSSINYLTQNQKDWLEIIPDKANKDGIIPHNDATEPSDKLFILKAKSSNVSEKERTAKFCILYPNENGDSIKTDSITITQLGKTKAQTKVNPDTIIFENRKDSINVGITSNVKWSIKKDNSSWLFVSQHEGGPDGDKSQTDSVKIIVEDNPNLSMRETIIYVERADGIEQDLGSISITQKGNVYLKIKDKEGSDAKEKKEDIIPFTPQEYKFYIESNLDGSVRNDKGDKWEWSISFDYPDEKDKNWLHLENTTGSGSRVIELKVDKNSKHGIRKSYIHIHFTDGLGVACDSVFTLIQRHCPKKPTIELTSKETEIKPTIGEEVTLTINTDSDHFPRVDEMYDDPSKIWTFVWTVDGQKENNKGNTLSKVYHEKKMYQIEVWAFYNDSQDLNETVKSNTANFYIFPAPKEPSNLEVKGQGTSGIMIATYAGLTDNTLRYVFGYDTINDKDTVAYEAGTTNNRYYQYDNSTIVKDGTCNKWVYTEWDIIDTRSNETHTVLSKLRRNTTDPITSPVVKAEKEKVTKSEYQGIASVSCGSVSLRGGRLVASMTCAAKAVLTVTAMNGTVVKRINYTPRRDFDEQIDLGGLPAGMYILRCNVGDMSTEEKIVIK